MSAQTPDRSAADREREDIEMLLPWYVTGRLDVDDMRRVANYLASHPDMNTQVQLIRAERDTAISGNEAIPGAPAGALDRLMKSIEAEPRSFGSGASASALSKWFGDLMDSFSIPAVRMAAATAAVLILAQAAALGFLLAPSGNGEGARYSTASDQRPGQGETAGTFALVRFAPEATIARSGKLLSDLDAQIVAGPMPGGIYRLKIASGKLGTQEAEKIIARLKAETGLIAFAVLASNGS